MSKVAEHFKRLHANDVAPVLTKVQLLVQHEGYTALVNRDEPHCGRVLMLGPSGQWMIRIILGPVSAHVRVLTAEPATGVIWHIAEYKTEVVSMYIPNDDVPLMLEVLVRGLAAVGA
jgi:hypothetical protein